MAGDVISRPLRKIEPPALDGSTGCVSNYQDSGISDHPAKVVRRIELLSSIGGEQWYPMLKQRLCQSRGDLCEHRGVTRQHCTVYFAVGQQAENFALLGAELLQESRRRAESGSSCPTGSISDYVDPRPIG